MKIHWLATGWTPYNDSLWNALAVDPAIDLVVHFSYLTRAMRPWDDIGLPSYSFRPYEVVLGIDRHLMRLALAEKESLFVVCGYMERTQQAVLLELASRRAPFVFWTDTPDLRKRKSVFRRLLRFMATRFVFANALAVMGTGQPGVNALSEMGCPREKLINFPYFVDLNAFQPPSQNDIKAQNSPLVFLVSGRLENAVKGYDLLMDALNLAREMSGNKAFRLLIAGEGPDRGRLHSQAEELGLGGQVEFLGWLEGDQVLEFYASGDVFLHPARQEPFGVVVLEAMAAGLPVIGSDITGAVRDRVIHGVNGFIHRSGDSMDLAKNIAFFLDRPDRIAEMGTQARKSAERWPLQRGVQIIKALGRGQVHIAREVSYGT